MAVERSDLVGAIWLTTPLALLLGARIPRHSRFLLVFSLFCTILAITYTFPYGEDPAKNYMFGTVFYVGLVHFNLLILSDPYIEHWWIAKKDGFDKDPSSNQSQQFHELSLLGQVRWAVDNSFSTRGIGWNWCIPHLPPAPQPSTSTTEFLLILGRRLVSEYVVHDLSAATLLHITRSGETSLLDLDFVWRSLGVACWAASTITLMDIGYHVLCLVGITTGLFWSRVEQVHPLMGPWSECFTLGRFWGRTWHQNFRRALQMPGQFLARDVVRAPKGSLLSRHLQSYTAFLLSGFYHYAAAKLIVSSEKFSGTCWFFALQPNALLLEDYVIGLAKDRHGYNSPRWRLLGYVWTFGILIYTSAGFVDECIRHKLVTAAPVFSHSATGLLLGLAR